MSTGKPISAAIRIAAINDYRNTGDSMTVVARRHGVSKTALSSWINPRPSKTRVRTYGADEVALTGGRWVGVGGIQRWESFTTRTDDDDDLTEHQRRVKAEDAMFTEDEARDAHARYAYGLRDERTVTGERVYNRRKKRAQTARKVAE